jgi:cephamycin C biosynthesis protein
VVSFDATVRQNAADRNSQVGVKAPHQRVHVDQNPRSALARAVRHGGAGRRFRRFQIVNAWRPLLHPVRNYPLALCDFRSLDPAADLVPTQLRFPAWLKDRENYSVRYRSCHRWFYWSALTPRELILLKCHDSASRLLMSDGEHGDAIQADVAGLSPHTSFVDPTAATEGRLRTSLEMRVLLFYD